MSKNELLRKFKDTIRNTIITLEQDNLYKEKIDQININIDEGEERPENYSIEGMIMKFYENKQFVKENFTTKQSIDKFKEECRSISEFLRINQQGMKAGQGANNKNKIWKPDKIVFSRKNPLSEIFR